MDILSARYLSGAGQAGLAFARCTDARGALCRRLCCVMGIFVVLNVRRSLTTDD